MKSDYEEAYSVMLRKWKKAGKWLFVFCISCCVGFFLMLLVYIFSENKLLYFPAGALYYAIYNSLIEATRAWRKE